MQKHKSPSPFREGENHYGCAVKIERKLSPEKESRAVSNCFALSGSVISEFFAKTVMPAIQQMPMMAAQTKHRAMLTICLFFTVTWL